MLTGPLEGMNLGRILRGEEWYVMVLRDKKGKLYVDVAHSPKRRLQEHNKSSKAKPWAKIGRPFEVAWQSPAMGQARALRLAVKVKKMDRRRKKDFISKGDLDVATV